MEKSESFWPLKINLIFRESFWPLKINLIFRHTFLANSDPSQITHRCQLVTGAVVHYFDKNNGLGVAVIIRDRVAPTSSMVEIRCEFAVEKAMEKIIRIR